MVTLPLSYVKGVFTAITIWKKQGNEMKNTWLFDSFIVFRLLLLRDTNSYFLSAPLLPGLIFKVVRTKEIIVLLKTSW